MYIKFSNFFSNEALKHWTGSSNNFGATYQRILHQSQSTAAKFRNERLAVNDCFLRNMQKYKYIANLDIDEIIVPQNFSTWSEMMETVSKKVKNKKVKNYVDLVFNNVKPKDWYFDHDQVQFRTELECVRLTNQKF